jgi:hypothetical protein
MSELKVNKIKGSNVPENGPDLTIDSSGNFNFDSGTLYVDSQNNRVGVNKTNPTQALDVNGGLKINDRFKIPTWTTETRPTSPEIGSVGYNTSAAISTVEMWTGTQWVRAGQAEPGLTAAYIASAGLTLISGTANDYNALYERVYSTPGSYTFTAPSTEYVATILVVGGGGGGGAYHAGGGGAGGVVYGKVTLTANQIYTVVVGSRGRGGIRDGNGGNDGEQGSDSSFGTFIAKGGGYGRWRCTSVDGGSGGGGGHHASTHCGQGERMSVSTQAAYAGMLTLGHGGGHGHNGHGAGGGGGAGGPGILSIAAGRNGQGGPGTFLMGRGIAGGGGGGAHSGQHNFAMPGGSGGGGHGRTENTQADSATSHGSGGGGGGHSTNGHGGSGSDGLVVIRMHAKTDTAAGTLIPTSYFTNNGFTLISGTAGQANATYRRNYTSLGAFSFTAPSIACRARVILVGGGGSSAGAHAGGGGGGGVVVGNYTLSANQVVTGFIGDGGAAATSYGGNGQNGENSTFGIWTALGGGGSDGTNSGQGANNGGSGGGGGPSSGSPGSGHVSAGAATQPSQTNTGATYNLGHAGGWGNHCYCSHGSGGGGGAGGLGIYSNATSSGGTHSKGNGDGGKGYYSPFLNAHWGGGGGGGGHNGNAWNAGGSGGAGGGGNGGAEGGLGGAGTANTGGGAGGNGHNSNNGVGARGGSGVCIIMIRADGDATRIDE